MALDTCRRLAAEQAQLLLAAQANLPDLLVTEHTDEEAIEGQMRERRAFFAEQEAEADTPPARNDTPGV
jgi:hypothetical protein